MSTLNIFGVRFMHIWTHSFQQAPPCTAPHQTLCETQTQKHHWNQHTHRYRGIQGRKVTSGIGVGLKNASESKLGAGTWENWWHLPIAGWGRVSGSRGRTGKGLVAANAIHAQRAAKKPGQADELRESWGWRVGASEREPYHTWRQCHAATLRLCLRQLDPSCERSKLAWLLAGPGRDKTCTG